MKAIECRISDAVADLEHLLASDVPVEQALADCAADEGLKVDVLRYRAEQILGDLETYKARNSVSASAASQARRAKNALLELRVLDERPEDFASWFMSRVGRFPTAEEFGESNRVLIERLSRIKT